jgi:hypothetical protein
MIGTCALCNKNANLQNSHLIPKWAYRRILENDPEKPRAPVAITDGNAVLSNKQTTAYLLCAECEQRFSTCENYVARLTELENGQIKLFAYITRSDTPKRKMASLNKDVDVEQLVYFAASVLWRGCVITGGCELGVYEPKFRQYLLNQAPFPPEAIITLGLFEESKDFDTLGWVSEPASKKASPVWVHGFLLTGLVFRCLVGKTLDQNLYQVSLAGPNPQKYVSILKPEECNDFLAAVEVASNAKHRGKLAETN